MKKFRAVVVVAIGFTLFMGTVAQADAPVDPNVPKLGLWLVENGGLTSMQPSIYANATQDFSNTRDLKLCGEITSQICTDAALIQINNYLPICTPDTQVNCISAVWAVDSSGKKIFGTAGKRVPEKGNGDYSAVPKMGLPAGNGQGNIFTFPGVKHAGGNNNYLVVVRDFYTLPKQPGVQASDLKYEVNNLHAAIIPVNEYQGNYHAGNVKDGYSGDSGGGTAPTGEDCQVTDNGTCFAAEDFPANYQFGISIRTANKIIGWFHGRIHSPTIQTTPVGSEGEEISIQAEPVRVTSLNFLADASSLPQEVKSAVIGTRDWGMIGSPLGDKLNAELDSPDAMTLFSLFNPVFKDKSTSEKTFWSVESMIPGQTQTPVTKCSSDIRDVSGIVTTNSLLYSSGPPTFNTSTESLDYKLASPHFESNGSVTSGSYDLLIRSNVARCIYGFSKAPISATISVLASDGTSKVATTVLGEKNGWLYLSAQGFDFSSPTVRVTLTQSAAATSPAKAPATKTSTAITCVKGKTSKKVTGVNPTCPSGYKKK